MRGVTRRVVQVDHDATRLGRRAPLELAVHGDVSATLRAVLPLLAQRTDRTFLDGMLARHARALETVVLLDDPSCYTENWTNPAAVPERLHVQLTPEEWRERLWTFSETSLWCRYDCLPAHPASELPALLPELAARSAWVTFDPTCTLMGQGVPMTALRARFPPPTVVLENRFEFAPVR